jgi:hypothetical protein
VIERRRKKITTCGQCSKSARYSCNRWDPSDEVWLCGPCMVLHLTGAHGWSLYEAEREIERQDAVFLNALAP